MFTLKSHTEDIIQDYVVLQLNIKTIAYKHKCCRKSISKILKSNGITLRTKSEVGKCKDSQHHIKPQKLTNVEDLQHAIDLYNNGMSPPDIGKIYNIQPHALLTKFRKLGLPIRNASEAAKLDSTNTKKKITCLERFGTEYPIQNPEIFKKYNISCYKFKSETIDGKTFTHLQGFEPQGIRYLITQHQINVFDIESGSKIPNIAYTFDGKRRIYYPDLYIPSKNILVEVKSIFTYNIDIDRNKEKRLATIKAGYNHITLIFDNKGINVISEF